MIQKLWVRHFKWHSVTVFLEDSYDQKEWYDTIFEKYIHWYINLRLPIFFTRLRVVSINLRLQIVSRPSNFDSLRDKVKPGSLEPVSLSRTLRQVV